MQSLADISVEKGSLPVPWPKKVWQAARGQLALKCTHAKDEASRYHVNFCANLR